MEDKKMLTMEVDQNGNKYYFYLPDNRPVGEVYDAAYQVLVKVTQYAAQIVEQSKRKEDQVVEAEVVQKGD